MLDGALIGKCTSVLKEVGADAGGGSTSSRRQGGAINLPRLEQLDLGMGQGLWHKRHASLSLHLPS